MRLQLSLCIKLMTTLIQNLTTLVRDERVDEAVHFSAVRCTPIEIYTDSAMARTLLHHRAPTD